jgi:hypothetical protein
MHACMHDWQFSKGPKFGVKYNPVMLLNLGDADACSWALTLSLSCTGMMPTAGATNLFVL